MSDDYEPGKEMPDRAELLAYIPKSFLLYFATAVAAYLMGFSCNKMSSSSVRNEQFGICRRAIERKFQIPEEEARKLLDYERKWEDR